MSPTRPVKKTGFVAFVGAGPGDPDLLTLRGVELLRKSIDDLKKVSGLDFKKVEERRERLVCF